MQVGLCPHVGPEQAAAAALWAQPGSSVKQAIVFPVLLGLGSRLTLQRCASLPKSLVMCCCCHLSCQAASAHANAADTPWHGIGSWQSVTFAAGMRESSTWAMCMAWESTPHPSTTPSMRASGCMGGSMGEQSPLLQGCPWGHACCGRVRVQFAVAGVSAWTLCMCSRR